AADQLGPLAVHHPQRLQRQAGVASRAPHAQLVAVHHHLGPGAGPGRHVAHQDVDVGVADQQYARVVQRLRSPRAHPFTPVSTTPSMIWRWKMKNTISTGMTASAALAMIRFQAVPASPENSATPTGMVRMLGLLATISGHRKAFQLPTKLKIASAARPGPTRGRPTRPSRPNSLTPSTRPASNRARGSDWKNWRMRKTPKAGIRPGKAMPQKVLTQPYSVDITYQGMTSISVGIISVLRISRKTKFLPGKRS